MYWLAFEKKSVFYEFWDETREKHELQFCCQQKNLANFDFKAKNIFKKLLQFLSSNKKLYYKFNHLTNLKI